MKAGEELIKFFTEEPDGVPQIIGTREDGWVRVERIEGTSPELSELKDGQRVGMGDGKTFHLRFTPLPIEEVYPRPDLIRKERERMGKAIVCEVRFCNYNEEGECVLDMVEISGAMSCGSFEARKEGDK